jgi:raffinose/stachyose/melibiose transport system substrate-binding protein
MADAEWQGWIKGWSAVPKVEYLYKGKIVVLNITNGPNFIYYWKDLFQKAGADVPKTIDDLSALVPKFRAIGVDTMVSGLDSTSLGNYDIWIWNLAGAINFDWAAKKQDDSCGAAWAGDPVAKQALDRFAKLYKDGVLRQQSPQEKYDPDAKQAFNQRKAAMFYPAGVWVNGGLGQDVGNVGAMFLPGLQAGSKPILMGSNDVAAAVLNAPAQQKNTERQAPIADLCKFMTSPDSQKTLWKVGLMPLMPEAITSEDTGAQKLTAEQIRLGSGSDVRTLFYNTTIPELADAQENAMLGLLIGAKTTDQVLADSDAGCAKVKKS